MMKPTLMTSLCAAAAFTAFSATAALAQTEILVPTDQATITDALTAAVDGDTIRIVDSATYAESLTVASEEGMPVGSNYDFINKVEGEQPDPPMEATNWELYQ